MKKIITVSVFTAFIMGVASNASASWWGSDNDYECYGPYGKIPGCNEYDEWDPRYWMEEMEDMFDDDDDYYRYGGYGRGYGMPYGGGYGMPYGGGYGMPYGGGYGQPYGGGYNPYAAPAAPAPAPVAPAQ
ncbi:MAG: sulfur globule protein [gamma proteobacterium symbiont of Bathyaustriella thionipta]|nr:sulfur globule protein [gamma proteobacterium symbiont of Bathyaustriella thionipta]MCU7949746.1 sulfur globule protein [gamma proteobacterium symbiont of Bathyaustriella thionipta]MCU7952485.1 sulfur globule protein [gamma proteobacterium symbiont of Bathyaustriella thionipta]MCU7956340.1 sulfur globule protein [gamma proteobacterium symbiont of Bathyaustriella thionipta]MCU7965817.1 sulfur globule protein [gamma proteobacterium symbiont of Bathyaustriella thionipta]